MMKSIEYFKGRTINTNEPVDVYRCLNRKGRVFSIRQKGLVVAHCTELDISGVKFVVNEYGKKKAIRTKQRNVHAFIRGMIGYHNIEGIPVLQPLKYDPFSESGFIIEQEEVHSSPLVSIRQHGIYAVKPLS